MTDTVCKRVIQVQRLTATIRYVNGERANYCVRILSDAGRVLCTGEQFEHERDAMRFADGARMALWSAGIPAELDLPDGGSVRPEQLEQEVSR